MDAGGDRAGCAGGGATSGEQTGEQTEERPTIDPSRGAPIDPSLRTSIDPSQGAPRDPSPATARSDETLPLSSLSPVSQHIDSLCLGGGARGASGGAREDSGGGRGVSLSPNEVEERPPPKQRPPPTATDGPEWPLRPIGFIHTPFVEKNGTPRQVFKNTDF